MSVKRRITISLKIPDAKRICCFLRETPCYNESRRQAVESLAGKLTKKIESAEQTRQGRKHESVEPK